MLTRNFRSRTEILAAAAHCIAHNAERSEALVAARGAGGRVTTRGFAHERDEAAWAAGLIADALAAGTPPGEMLVLARTGYATGPTQSALAAAGIPHRVLGSSASTSAPRSATRSPTSRCSPTRRRARVPARRPGAAARHRRRHRGRVVAAAREHYGGDLITACAHAHALTGRPLEARARALAAFGDGLEAVRAH